MGRWACQGAERSQQAVGHLQRQELTRFSKTVRAARHHAKASRSMSLIRSAFTRALAMIVQLASRFDPGWSLTQWAHANDGA